MRDRRAFGKAARPGCRAKPAAGRSGGSPGRGDPPGRAGLKTTRFGRLAIQLALAFVGVAVAAVVASVVVTALTVTAAEKQILARQEVMQTSAAALGASATYARAGWRAELAPVIAVVNRAGAAALVRDAAGRVVRSSARYARFPRRPAYRAPVVAGGRRVGSITLRFGDRGVSAALARFNTQRWRARLIGGSIGALLALAVALVLAPRITAPLTRLLHAARSRGGGQLDARAGKVRGFRDLRELAATFDQMANALGRQEQLRRNLVADIAHQLRTPASVLQAGSEAMLDGITSPTASNISSLRDESIRLSRMIDDLQQLSSAEAAAVQLALARCDLAASAAAAADALADIFERAGVRFNRQLDPVTARCDQHRIHDVITNLLTNAAKYTPGGGSVTLQTRPAGPDAMLRVSDTGTGIPPDELPRITSRFYRGTNAVGVSGSGIGLAIVDELVRGHNGRIDITSQQGIGTQVTIILPRT